MSSWRWSRRGFIAQGAATIVAAAVPAEVLKIELVELIELHGRYTDEAGVNGQQQVNPEDVYDGLRPEPYQDRPAGKKEMHTSAVYLRIRTSGGVEGLY